MFCFRLKYGAALVLLFVCVCFGVVFAVARERTEPVSGESGKEISVVVLDAGHGGTDGGTVGRAGTVEKDINLEIVLQTRAFCDFFGVETVLTRETDISLGEGSTIREQKINDLKTRVQIANGVKNAAVISIHQNYYDDYVSRGAQVFYGEDNLYGKSMACRMQSFLKEYCYSDNKRQAMPIPNGNYMLENLSCPAIIIECGFLSQLEEEMLLNSPEYQAKIAFAVAVGALDAVVGGVGADVQ